MIEVTLYGRQNCHLCDEAEADLKALQAVVPHRLTVIDIDSSPELVQAYGLEIPVVEIGPYRLKAPITAQELEITLRAAQDRQQQLETLNTPAYGNRWTGADKVSYWLSRHWLALFNLIVFIYAGLPFLAPVLMAAGAPGLAQPIYRAYSFVCHQLPYRSFFLFGEQPVYPRAAAGLEGLQSFEAVTGIGEGSSSQELLDARTFVGNPATGYKIALCQRDVAIYGAILLFGLIFGLTGRRLPPLHWLVWILVGILPIAVDGFSQLFSQPPFNFLPYRESTPLFRALTGGLFGFMTAWFGYPMVEKSMAESRQYMSEKLLRVRQSQKQT